MHTAPIPDPLADPTRDPDSERTSPPTPGHHNDEPQRPEGPPEKDPVTRPDARHAHDRYDEYDECEEHVAASRDALSLCE
ncbi:hypothetical protein [Paraburkholderia kururiensis]|uniref:hypothetical protein n=1 Tax=Paraburkholderia kururiensis TaxID=984307 RepID=UPI00146FCD5B|nr:hypothetical protein [Paraburkholderia kururiensis]